MCEKTIEQTNENTSNWKVVKNFLKHRWRFWIIAGAATIGIEKFLFEIITKHEHLSRSEVPIHAIADITWCFLGEIGASLMKKKWVSEKYSQAISLAINGASHALYEIWHHSIHHTHGYEHEDHNHTVADHMCIYLPNFCARSTRTKYFEPEDVCAAGPADGINKKISQDHAGITNCQRPDWINFV